VCKLVKHCFKCVRGLGMSIMLTAYYRPIYRSILPSTHRGSLIEICYSRPTGYAIIIFSAHVLAIALTIPIIKLCVISAVWCIYALQRNINLVHTYIHKVPVRSRSIFGGANRPIHLI